MPEANEPPLKRIGIKKCLYLFFINETFLLAFSITIKQKFLQKHLYGNKVPFVILQMR